MPDAVKPEICLTGKLLYPVHIGLPAYIQETDGYRRTSTVCAILADTQEATVIETRNSVYSIKDWRLANGCIDIRFHLWTAQVQLRYSDSDCWCESLCVY